MPDALLGALLGDGCSDGKSKLDQVSLADLIGVNVLHPVKMKTIRQSGKMIAFIAGL